jgi:hypothetical protein
MYVPFSVFCVLFVCKCVLYYCHRVSTHLQLKVDKYEKAGSVVCGHCDKNDGTHVSFGYNKLRIRWKSSSAILLKTQMMRRMTSSCSARRAVPHTTRNAVAALLNVFGGPIINHRSGQFFLLMRCHPTYLWEYFKDNVEIILSSGTGHRWRYGACALRAE